MTQISLFDGMHPFKIDKPIRLIELFAGIGSQAKALENLGVEFEHYRICEFDKYAVASYNAVHSTDFNISDITQIHADDLGIIDTDKFDYIMTYSFPCTDLSTAGKKQGMAKGSGTRSGLLWEVERLLDECVELPQVLLMENVTEVHGEKNKYDFYDWYNKLESLGYHNYWKDLNAKNFGIPQNRNRCFMVSILGDYYYEFPKEIPLKLRLKDMLEENVDEKYYLSYKALKVIINSNFNSAKLVQVAQLQDSKYNDMSGRVYNIKGLSPTIRTCQVGNLEPKIIEPFALDEQNQYIIADGIVGTLTCDGSSPKHNNRVIEHIQEDFLYDAYNKKQIDSNTSNTRCGTFFVKPVNNYRIRKLTPKECWRLMGFNDSDFNNAQKVNSNSQLYRQAGNSIVVDVLMAIFKNLL